MSQPWSHCLSVVVDLAEMLPPVTFVLARRVQPTQIKHWLTFFEDVMDLLLEKNRCPSFFDYMKAD